jgi:histidine triad (HIT) family protein
MSARLAASHRREQPHRGHEAAVGFQSCRIHAIIQSTMHIKETSVVVPTCVFCEIVRGAAPSSIVYADASVLAFMDIQPVNEGHVLVVPRAHAARMDELDGETGAQMFGVAIKLSTAMRQSEVRCEGVNLFLADGEAAGQEVFHVHLHVIPRYWGDGFGFRFGAGYHILPYRARLDEVAADIRRAVEVGRDAL